MSRLTRQPMHMGGRPKGPFRSLLLVVMLLACVGAAGWAYFMGVPDQIRFFHTGGEDLDTARRARSLLEVVNVGEIYRAQWNKVNRAGFVPGLDEDLIRGQAQAALQAEAAGPLLKQTDLFIELVGQGIQQSRRPARETARLETLKEQGQILRSELYRLELAWHSLEKDVGWEDLCSLSDDQVKIRRDSLAAADATALAENQSALGTTDYWRPLEAATRQVTGMHDLLELFQRETWSAQWEKDLYRAAERVSPNLNHVTRAYRNSAFTLVRLKRAERMEGSLALPYALERGAGRSTSAEVHDVLPNLRRQAGKFATGEAPDLLAGLLSLYQVLGDAHLLDKDPAKVLKRIEGVRRNYSYKFDAKVYEPYLERLRFEVLHSALTAGKTPESLPDGSFGAVDRAAALEFHTALGQNPSVVDWDSLSRRNEGTFLGRWAGKLARSQHELVATRVVSGDASWRECRLLLADLKQRVAAGTDWTSVWVDLNRELTRAQELHKGWSLRDPARRQRPGKLAELAGLLTEARPLRLETVTIRLDPEVLTSQARVQLEILGTDGDAIQRSEPFPIGPAAPEGTGWVGTGYLSVTAEVSPLETITCRVRSVTNGETLLEIVYPSLADRVGPGGLSRLRAVDGGSLQFRWGDGWWRSLQLSDLVDGGGAI